MKKANFILGISAFLLMTAAAFANVRRHRDIIVYFSENGVGIPTSINFDCNAAGRGCVKLIRGVQEQLYADPDLTYSLRQGL